MKKDSEVKLSKYIYIILLLLLSIVSIFVGVKDISFWEVFSLEDDQQLVLFASRIPRVVSILLTGVGISICGLIMQQITRNKFVSPTTAGTLDAAKMGILMSVLLMPQTNAFLKMLFAFVFTFAASVLFLNIVRRIKYKSVIFLPLVGIMFGNILSAVSTYFAFKYGIVQNMQAWLVGDFSAVLRGRYEMLYVSIPVIILTYMYANRFTIAGMGEDMATNLGLNYKRVVYLGFMMVSLTVSVITITVGTIPFLGLIIPNLVSMMYGDNLKKTLPYTAMLGALFLLVCDILGRLLIMPYEIPIGLMVGVIGGVIFLVILIRNNR